ncbi:MAG: hypothetical protein ABJA61_10355 [Caldimonas sp.]
MGIATKVLSRVSILCVAALTACASTDYHFSQLVGKRYFRAPIDTYSVSVVRVDGKDNVFRPALVDPGLRQVTVQGPPGGAGGVGEQRTIALNVAPCTRYYLVAVKTNTLASDFSVRVDYQEPVSGCTAPKAS